MANFGWAYIDCTASVSIDGPTGSLLFMSGANAASGSSRFRFLTSSSTLELTGTFNISGALNVIGTTTTLSSSNLIIRDPVIGLGFGTSSAHTGTVGDRGFIFGLDGNLNQAILWDQSSASFVMGKVGAIGPDRAAYDIPEANFSAFKVGSVKFTDKVSGSGEIFSYSLRTSGDLSVTGSTTLKNKLSSSGELFGYSLRTSGDLSVSGSTTLKNKLSSSGELFGYDLRTSGDLNVTGAATIKGNVTLGDAATDVTTVTSKLTASQGVLIADDQKIFFGADADAYIKFEPEAGGGTGVPEVLIISGSKEGLWISGSVYFAPLGVVSGTAAGPGSFCTLDANNKLVLAPGGQPGGTDTQIQYNNGGSELGGIAVFTWDDTDLKVADDTKLYFGTNSDGHLEYDENGTNLLIISGASAGLKLQGTTVLVDGKVSGSAEIFSYSLRTSGDIAASGSLTVGGITAGPSAMSSSGDIFTVGGLATSGDLAITGSTTLKSKLSSSGEIFSYSLRTSGDIAASGSLTVGGITAGPGAMSSSGDIFTVGGLATSGDIAATGSLTIGGDTNTFSSANANDPLVIIKNTTNDTGGARLRFVKDKGSAGADNDVCGAIEFYGDDDAQDQVLFAGISAQVADATNGQEGGKLSLSVATHDGEFQDGLVITDGSAEDEVDVTIGNGAASLVTIAGDLDIPNGGFALGSDASGDMYYNNSSGILTRIAVGSDNHVLTLDGEVPGWEAAAGGGSAASYLALNLVDDQVFAVSASNDVLALNSSGSDENTVAYMTASLLAASNYDAGQRLIFKDAGGTASTNLIIVEPSGSETIDGSNAGVAIGSNYGSVTLVCDGSSKFFIIGTN